MRAIVTVLAVLVLAGCAQDSARWGWGEADRTKNRTTVGEIFYPRWIMNRPEHYAFTPAVSNHDPQHQHPAQWAGQEWDPAMWNKDWTPEITIARLYDAKVFSDQYVEKGVPVLEVGPRFWKISDLDRRRALKLLADHSGVFGQGYQAVILRDWHSKEAVGSYTARGMKLN